jgi:cell division protease FtsH
MVILLLAAALVALFLGDQFGTSEINLTYGQFKQHLMAGHIREVRIGSNKISGYFREKVRTRDEQGKEIEVDMRELLPEKYRRLKELRFVTRTPTVVPDNLLTQQLDQMQVDWDYEKETAGWIWAVLVYWLPTFLLLGLLVLLFAARFRDPLGGGFLSSYIKSPARRFDKGKVRVTFNDVADMEHAKAELQEVVEFLRNPEKFQRLGGQIPKGNFAGRPSGNRENVAGSCCGRGSGRAIFQHQWFGIHSDVRGRRCQPGS